MNRPDTGRVVAGGLVAVAAVRWCSELWLVLTAPLGELVRRTPDDAWYYLGVARNLAAGRGASFDGREVTNGFQPLWQLVEGGLALVWHGTALVRAALIAGQVLTAAGLVLFLLVVSRVVRLGPVAAGVVAVVVVSPPVWARLNDGMESAVVVATVAVLAAAVERWWRDPTARRFGLVGVASGLCCLARMSTLPVVALVPAVLLVVGPARVSWRRAGGAAAVWAAGAAATLVPWFVWSWSAAGSPVQVSSRVKWHWARAASGPVWSSTGLGDAWRAGTEELWRQVRLGLPIVAGAPAVLRRAAELVAVVVVAWAVGRAVRSSRRALILVVPVLMLVARYGIEVLALPTLVANWYAAPVLPFTATAATLIGAAAVRVAGRRVGAARWRAARPALGALVMAAAIGVALLPSGRPSGTWGLANLEAGRELAHLRGAAGAFDAGVVGWAHPGTVDLDGLVRSPATLDRLLRTPPARVAVDAGVRYLVGRALPGDDRVPACGRVVWRSPTRVGLPGQPAVPVRIWDLSGCAR